MWRNEARSTWPHIRPSSGTPQSPLGKGGQSLPHRSVKTTSFQQCHWIVRGRDRGIVCGYTDTMMQVALWYVVVSGVRLVRLVSYGCTYDSFRVRLEA